MITFFLTDSDIVNAIQSAARQPSGCLAVHLPMSAIQERASDRIILEFDLNNRTVRRESISIRLSPLQFSLLQYIYDNGRASYEALQDNVWHRNVSDNAIHLIVSRLNTSLLDAGFACELITKHSRISLESAA